MYHLPPGVDLSEIDGRPVLSTEQGGQIAIDQKLLALWKTAIDKDLPAILAAFKEQGKNDKEIRAGVSCLAEAGLLKRGEAKESPARVERSGELVSIVIVAHNSLDSTGR
jgi:hypothetical protein